MKRAKKIRELSQNIENFSSNKGKKFQEQIKNRWISINRMNPFAFRCAFLERKRNYRTETDSQMDCVLV